MTRVSQIGPCPLQEQDITKIITLECPDYPYTHFTISFLIRTTSSGPAKRDNRTLTETLQIRPESLKNKVCEHIRHSDNRGRRAD